MDKIMKHAAVRKWAICFSGILITLFLSSALAWAEGPTVSIVSPLDGEVVGSFVQFAFQSDGVSFTCTIDGVPLFECVPDTQIDFTFPTGESRIHEFVVAASDAVGNTTTVVVAFLVDAIGPVITVTQAPGPSGAGPDSTEATEIRWFAQDYNNMSPPIVFSCALDGTAVACPATYLSSGVFNGVFTWANLCNGNHLLEIVAIDALGNPGPVNPYSRLGFGATVVFNTSGGSPCQPAPITFTITASAGANGSISPSGAVTVNSGADQTFTITANTGYYIADVLVDGASVGAVGSYPFSNVTTNHTISAGFAMNPYTFSGFFSPVENLPTVNLAKAGQTIPVKWQISGENSIPIADPASFKSLTSYIVSCDSLSGDSTSAVEDYAAGSSGLQYLGDGYWQFNWQAPKTYSGQCRTMVLTLRDGTTHTASFKFK